MNNYSIVKKLNRFNNVNSIDRNIFNKIVLDQSVKEISNTEISNFLNLTDRSNVERQRSTKFKIHFKINYISFLNNINKFYNSVEEFLSKPDLTQEIKNISNSFDVYLCILSDENIDIGGNEFIRNYRVIEKHSNIDLFTLAYEKNIYNESNYLGVINSTIDITNYVDSFGKPVKDFYLYFNYRPEVQDGGNEVVSFYNFEDDDFENMVFQIYDIGDNIYGDLVSYSNGNFEDQLLQNQEYKISCPVDPTNRLVFKYNPFIPIKIRDFGDELFSGESNDPNLIIPNYAVNTVDNIFIWKEFLEYGFITDELGTDYPFVNGQHYVYDNLSLSIFPDVSDTFTNTSFTNIRFPERSFIKTINLDNFNETNKPC